MQEILHEYPQYAEYKYSLCDHFIDQIQIDENSISFIFQRGYTIFENGGVRACNYGKIRLIGCHDNGDISCWIINHKKSMNGTEIIGRPCSVKALSKILKHKNAKIEILCEMYEAHRLHWRGVLCSGITRRLRPLVIFETIDDFELEYYWE